MDIVYLLYIVKINKFSKFEKFTMIKLMKISFGDVRKTGFGGLQLALSLIAKWSLMSVLMTWCSDTKFCMFVKSKSIIVLEFLKHLVYSVTSWLYWLRLIRVSKLSFKTEFVDQSKLKSPTIIVGLRKILAFRSCSKLLFNLLATLETNTRQNLRCTMIISMTRISVSPHFAKSILSNFMFCLIL